MSLILSSFTYPPIPLAIGPSEIRDDKLRRVELLRRRDMGRPGKAPHSKLHYCPCGEENISIYASFSKNVEYEFRMLFIQHVEAI
jgi:hypothetical protein